MSEETDKVSIKYMQLYEAARKEVERLRTMSAVEMMCENLNVKHHIEEWEQRCLKAEARQHQSDLNYAALEKQNTRLMKAIAEREASKQLPGDPDVIGRYSGKDGHRDWWSGGAWLMPGQVVAVIDQK